MLNLIKRESKFILASLVIGIVFMLSAAAYTYVYSETTQRGIAENVIRFHVRAHSDTEEDQLLKEYVRTEILEAFAATLSANTSVEEARENFTEILPQIQSYAEELVRDAGFEYSVTAELTTAFFPTQVYGEIAFPPGNYEAVQITIGDGGGKNWWCLMFPPLCYVDMTATDEARNQLSATVSDEGFRLLTHQENPSPQVSVRFRIVEWWQNRNQPSRQTPPPSQQTMRR